MKATFEREKLHRAFQLAAAVAAPRSIKPILQNVMLEVEDSAAVLISTDLEIGIRVSVPGFVADKSGSVVLPRESFGKILAESSDETLQLESDGLKLLVRGQHSEFQLPTANPSEFPEVATFQEKQHYEVSARFFREVVRRTVFATDVESTRYALGGVLLEVADNVLAAVATDGRRMTCQEGPVKSVGKRAGEAPNTIVPTRAMQLVERVISDRGKDEETLLIAARENDVLFHIAGVTVYSSLVEGRFPKWRDVFPQREGGLKIELTVGPFYAAVRQAAIVTDREHRGVDFGFSSGRVTLAAYGSELGEARIELPCTYEGAEQKITLDPQFLTDFLRVLDPAQTFVFTMFDAQSAAICRTSDGYAYVVMPLAR